jgi:thiamine-phosphate pyrophosphorylase
MKRLLPFTRVAIVPPLILLSDLEEWLKHALRFGANSVYLRFKDANVYKKAIDTIGAKKWYLYDFPITWILSAEYSELPFWASALHFKSNTNTNRVASAFQPHILYRGKSCHNCRDLKEAEDLGYDYAFLSPVFSTSTHPESRPIGLQKFKEWASQVRIPIFALGGVSLDKEAELLSAGAYGIAGINCFKTGL